MSLPHQEDTKLSKILFFVFDASMGLNVSEILKIDLHNPYQTL